MNLSARKAIGLLSMFALMLVSVSCEEDEAKTTNDVAVDSSEVKVSFEECAQQVAAKVVQYSVPDGVKELIAHVSKFDKFDDDEMKAAGYKSIAHVSGACDEMEGIYSEIADEIECMIEFDEDYSADDYIKVNSSIKPLIDAARACDINEKFQSIECIEKLNDYLAHYTYPEEASDLVECVKYASYKSIVYDLSCHDHVNARACLEVEKKYEETLSSDQCASRDVLIYSIENSKEGHAADLLFKAVRACKI